MFTIRRIWCTCNYNHLRIGNRDSGIKHIALPLLTAVLVFSTACNLSPTSANSNSSSNSNIAVSVSPTSIVLSTNQKQQFTATITGTAKTGVVWSSTTGSIDSNGLFTAPTSVNPATVIVTAVSQADSSRTASATVKLEGAPNYTRPNITTAGLAKGQVGQTYEQSLSVSGGLPPFTWKMSSGSVPNGLTLGQNGQISGVPNQAGTYSFTVTVTDAKNNSDQQSLSMSVSSGGNFDGPAELPRVTMSTSMASTPATGKTITVSAGGDLQSALNSADCGDTITLQEGATFTGVFQFPQKSCDDSHWVIVRTSAPDSALPAEGQRISPCYAGVASLTGRPSYGCTNPQKILARLVLATQQDGPVEFNVGANHYRLVGLEITRAAGVPGGPTLITTPQSGTIDHIIIDRSWVHGTTNDDTRAGFYLSGSSYVGIIDSYFSDFHCTSETGACTDAHTICGGTRDNQDGVYQIEDNFLEASGEGLIFGGGPATTTPADITIRKNHFFKPWQWRQGNAGFVGGNSGNPFIVKNHLELKNAMRVLIEDNLMENVWGGFSQSGYGLLLTPLNQSTGAGNVCPACQVSDITVRYVHISHGGGGMQLVTSISTGAPGLAGTRWSIHDVVMDDINSSYAGPGVLFEVQNGWPVNPINNVVINHVTGFPDSAAGGIISTGNDVTNPEMGPFTFTNSIVSSGRYPVWNALPPGSCADSDVPITIFNSCFTTSTFNHNAMIATPSAFPVSKWPSGNYFPASTANVGFVSYGTGNYQLESNSPYANKGSDGLNLGADIAGLNDALSGVE